MHWLSSQACLQCLNSSNMWFHYFDVRKSTLENLTLVVNCFYPNTSAHILLVKVRYVATILPLQVCTGEENQNIGDQYCLHTYLYIQVKSGNGREVCKYTWRCCEKIQDGRLGTSQDCSSQWKHRGWMDAAFPDRFLLPTDQEIPRRRSPTGRQSGCFNQRSCFHRRGCFASASAWRLSIQNTLVWLPF